MQIEENISRQLDMVDLCGLEDNLAARLSDNVKSIRVVYRHGYSVHAMVVRWIFGVHTVRIYELLIEITTPYKTGEDLWPLTLEEEMDLLYFEDERWEVERIFVMRTARKQTGTVVLKRYRNRRLEP